jgi:Fur family iron response transcriptional regulator
MARRTHSAGPSAHAAARSAAPALGTLLRDHGIQPSAQRIAIAECVLCAHDHPSADLLLARVQARLPQVSRATVYNTLHLFVERGLLRAWSLAEGRTVYDPKVEPHHHLIDERDGSIHDVPWEALEVAGTEHLPGYVVASYQVVLRGRRRAP